jgi:hypothetical protein
MKLIEVTKEDAIKMADLLALLQHTNKLIDAMKVAGIQMQGRAVEQKEAAFTWIKEIATGMANELQAKAAAAEPKPATKPSDITKVKVTQGKPRPTPVPTSKSSPKKKARAT